MNRYEANVSPYRRPATVSKKTVSPSSERTLTLLFLLRIIMATAVSLKRRLEVFAPFCVWSQMPWRNLEIRVFVAVFEGNTSEVVIV